MNARRNARDDERLPQHSEAHLNWSLINLMTRFPSPLRIHGSRLHSQRPCSPGLGLRPTEIRNIRGPGLDHSPRDTAFAQVKAFCGPYHQQTKNPRARA